MEAAGNLRKLSTNPFQIKVLSEIMAPILNQEAGFGDYTYKGQALSSLTDKQIVLLINSGHKDAFPELYHRYSKDIYGYLLRLISSPGAAEDLLQEVFVAVWQGLDAFKQESSLKTWLFRIAHYKTMSWMRVAYRIQEVDQEETNYGETGLSLDSQTALNWQADKIQEALQNLSTNHRAVVELFYYYGLSYSEISDVVDCPVGTVKSRMSHALKNLSAILTNYGLEP